MSKTRVVLVDDHRLFREGLAALLGYQDDFEVVGQAASGNEALAVIALALPDVVLLDVAMPDGSGLWALPRIVSAQPAVQVVMLTVHESDEMLFEAIKNGAQGYLLKNVPATDMLAMLRGLATGEAAVTRATAMRLLREFARQNEPSPPPVPSTDTTAALTLREREILERVAARATNKEIAQALSISEYTVKNHLRNILSKLHARNRAQAAAQFRRIEQN